MVEVFFVNRYCQLRSKKLLHYDVLMYADFG